MSHRAWDTSSPWATLYGVTLALDGTVLSKKELVQNLEVYLNSQLLLEDQVIYLSHQSFEVD